VHVHFCWQARGLPKHGSHHGCGSWFWRCFRACPHVPMAPPQRSPPCPDPEAAAAGCDGKRSLNPGERGEPLATVVRIYQLRARARSAERRSRRSRPRQGTRRRAGLLREVTLNPADRSIGLDAGDGVQLRCVWRCFAVGRDLLARHLSFAAVDPTVFPSEPYPPARARVFEPSRTRTGRDR